MNPDLMMTIPQELVPTNKALLLSSTPVEHLYFVPAFKHYSDQDREDNNKGYISIREFLENPIRAMKMAFDMHGKHVELARQVVYAAYRLGVATCTPEEIASATGLSVNDVHEELHRLRYEVAIHNKVLPYFITDKLCRLSEFRECKRAQNEFLRNGAPSPSQLALELSKLQ